ncbi:deoxyribodipyrimidine photo-lyase [Spirosomataceae bacterium TFI 002]|nr:deoxyribodipyrimidine photo-lyase [Spirosomataceae bacterium TFI 002]
MKAQTNIFWLRRDLRLEDNTGLYYALSNNLPVQLIFIFDQNILDKLNKPYDARVEFIHNQLDRLKSEAAKFGASLKVYYGVPIEIWETITQEFKVGTVYTNRDYEKYAIKRDESVRQLLEQKGIDFKAFKDQVIFEKKEVLSKSGTPYSVFTPYSRKWKETLAEEGLKECDCKGLLTNLAKSETASIISLKEMGFEATDQVFPENEVDKEVVRKYTEQRDYPGIEGTSRLSVHLRFGTVSIRSLVKQALKLNNTWLNELIWRDFYMQILANFPHINDSKAFRPAYDQIPWRNDEANFEKWKNGNTGFPIVDAGMRELNATGFMHNRVRMIVSSFLIKDLLIDWRWGEAYFAEKLLDFDFSANNGGWQWAAGSGCDAAPYFRVFNPDSQAKKFDPDLKYIKKWIPELNEFSYPKPMVDHKMARERAIKTYKEALT